MKVAVIKLGSRIAIDNNAKSCAGGESVSIIRMLTTAGVQVDAYTKVLEKDFRPTDFNLYDIEKNYSSINDKGYDALLVINGNVNYYGGADNPAQTLNYHIINHFIGKVFYIMCDCYLPLRQLWPSIERKPWSSNYNKSDILITRDDITYITQAKDIHGIKSYIMKRGINIKDVLYYPLEKFPLLTQNGLSFNENSKYDILYGGTFRGGRREDDMIKYFFNYPNDINVTMFGGVNLTDFNVEKIQGLIPPRFEKPTTYGGYYEKMNTSKATIVIGDKLYKKYNLLPQRVYESIMTRTVVLIDSSYDYSKRIFKNKELLDFNYVRSSADVIDRVNKLKDLEFRKHIAQLQVEDVAIDLNKYCTDFVSLLI